MLSLNWNHRANKYSCTMLNSYINTWKKYLEPSPNRVWMHQKEKENLAINLKCGLHQRREEGKQKAWILELYMCICGPRIQN